jgi:hypothetical protein
MGKRCRRLEGLDAIVDAREVWAWEDMAWGCTGIYTRMSAHLPNLSVARSTGAALV